MSVFKLFDFARIISDILRKVFFVCFHIWRKINNSFYKETYSSDVFKIKLTHFMVLYKKIPYKLRCF